jgi:hypothetical protein
LKRFPFFDPNGGQNKRMPLLLGWLFSLKFSLQSNWYQRKNRDVAFFETTQPVAKKTSGK